MICVVKGQSDHFHVLDGFSHHHHTVVEEMEEHNILKFHYHTASGKLKIKTEDSDDDSDKSCVTVENEEEEQSEQDILLSELNKINNGMSDVGVNGEQRGVTNRASKIPIPLERHICNFIDDCPAPPPGKVDIIYYLQETALHFRCPAANEPNVWSGLPLFPLFECLSPENICALFALVLTERQLLFVSSQYSLLTACA
eukprot:gene28826-35757_t